MADVQLLTFEQTAELLAISKWQVRKLVARRDLPVVRLSARCLRIKEADVRRFIAARTT